MIIHRRTRFILVAALLCSMFFLEFSAAMQENQSYDEGIHLAAGVSYWRTGDFRMNPEHPPLIKLIAAIPVSLTHAVVHTENDAWKNIDGWTFGDLFLYQNRLGPQTLLMLGRLPIMLLSLLLGYWIFQASREMFGDLGGLLSLSLYAFDPSIIAHSGFITTDLGFTAFAFLSLYRLVKLMERPSTLNAAWFGAAFLAASLSKFSGMVLLVVLLFVIVLLKIREKKHSALIGRQVRRWFFIGLPIAAVITWGMYNFDIRRPADDPRISSLYTQREKMIESGEAERFSAFDRFVIVDFGNIRGPFGTMQKSLIGFHIPMYTFFRGVFAVISHNEGGHGSYLLGQHSEMGWWYYFPVAIVAKTPFPTFVAFLSVALFILMSVKVRRQLRQTWSSMYRSIDRRWIIYGMFPTIFLFISMMSNLNLGWRHVMPLYPPLFVLTGSLANLRPPIPQWKVWYLPLLLVVSIMVVQIGTFPNEMGYFSNLVGGSRKGPTILLDSNLDWGQDILKLGRFVVQQKLTEIPFAYYGRANVPTYVPQAVRLPTNDDIARNGLPVVPVAISVGELMRQDGQYRWLWRFRPSKIIGSSIYVYQFPLPG